MRANILELDGLTSDGTKSEGEVFFRSDLGELRYTGFAGDILTAGRVDNLNASASPTANDDSGDGYAVGSVWIDTTNDVSWVCVDATAAAAIWTPTTPVVLTASSASETNFTSTSLQSIVSVTVTVAGIYSVVASGIARDANGEAGRTAITKAALVSLGGDECLWNLGSSSYRVTAANRYRGSFSASDEIHFAGRNASGAADSFVDNPYLIATLEASA